jgi:hypothetical protein
MIVGGRGAAGKDACQGDSCGLSLDGIQVSHATRLLMVNYVKTLLQAGGKGKKRNWGLSRHQQVTEKVLMLSLRAGPSLVIARHMRSNLDFIALDKLRNLRVQDINHFEIAASRKTLLAMTIQNFFSATCSKNEKGGPDTAGPPGQAHFIRCAN